MKPTTDASAPTADQFAGALPDRYLRCRELGHVWRPATASWDRKERVYDRMLRCSSCRTERHQILNEYGHVLSNRYQYPDHYLTQGVQRGTYTRDVFRLEAIIRYIDHDKKAAG